MPAAIAFVAALGLLVMAMLLPLALALLVWLCELVLWVLAVVWWALCGVARGARFLVASGIRYLRGKS